MILTQVFIGPPYPMLTLWIRRGEKKLKKVAEADLSPLEGLWTRVCHALSEQQIPSFRLGERNVKREGGHSSAPLESSTEMTLGGSRDKIQLAKNPRKLREQSWRSKIEGD